MIPDVLDKQQALFRRNLNHFASLRSYAQLPLNLIALRWFLRLVTGPEVSVNPGRRRFQRWIFTEENPPNMPEYRRLFDETISQRGR